MNTERRLRLAEDSLKRLDKVRQTHFSIVIVTQSVRGISLIKGVIIYYIFL